MKISMKLGPQQTDRSKFQGFGMKASGSAAASVSTPGGLLAGGPSRGSAAAKAKAAPGGVTALFRESLDDDENRKKKSSVPAWSKPTMEAVQAQRQAEALQAEDPSVFQYDEVIDDVKRDLDVEKPLSQMVRTDALVQKKRVGLTVLPGAEAVRAGQKREAKYIEKVIIATDRRRAEQQIVEDRLLKKEQDAREGREVFVTGGFKEELKRRKKFEEELEEQELRDSMRDATKQEDGRGFADFHRTLLNDGLASSRGGEKIKEQAPAREDVPMEEPIKKEEDTDEDGDKAAKTEATKKEEEEAPQNGLQDVETPSAGSKAAKALAEQAERAEKAMSAKERFLARKKAAADGAG